VLKNPVKRLDALTSLRFFAAAMIVIHHSRGEFGLSQHLFRGVFLGQAVSFFFVLSGFILAYAYQDMKNREDVKRFFVARVARLWPAHVATFCIVLVFMYPHSSSWDITLANLLMIQAWIPLPHYFFSYNAVSWSISTEFFFYFSFVLIFFFLRERLLLALAFAFALALSAVFLADLWHLSMYRPGENVLSIDALVYIHPFARLFEFVFGVVVFTLWKSHSGRFQMGLKSTAVLELLALLMVAAGIYYIPHLAFYYQEEIGMPAVKWLVSTGCFLLFGLLIFMMALDRGIVSRFLSLPMLVLLGEISYSLYLVHTILIRKYHQSAELYASLPAWVIYPLFWLLLLIVAHLIWYLIERPGRKLILGLFSYGDVERKTFFNAVQDAISMLAPNEKKPCSLRNLKLGWLFCEVLLMFGMVALFIYLAG